MCTGGGRRGGRWLWWRHRRGLRPGRRSRRPRDRLRRSGGPHCETAGASPGGGPDANAGQHHIRSTALAATAPPRSLSRRERAGRRLFGTLDHQHAADPLAGKIDEPHSAAMPSLGTIRHEHPQIAFWVAGWRRAGLGPAITGGGRPRRAWRRSTRAEAGQRGRPGWRAAPGPRRRLPAWAPRGPGHRPDRIPWQGPPWPGRRGQGRGQARPANRAVWM